MSENKKNFVNKIVAVLMILFLNLTDFLFVGEGFITYALDASKTNHSNVEFSAYFLDNNGNKKDQMEENIDADNLKLYVDVAVKNEGYFNGKISIENSNFSLKQENGNQDISEISGNTVTLNQINAGSTVTLGFEIEPIKEKNIDVATLSAKTDVILKGNYVNSKNVEKDKAIEIEGKTTVELDWKSSNNSEITLEAKLLTNKVYEIDNQEKRVVQILVKNSLKDNSYPVKSTKIQLDVPEKVQDVNVFARSNESTNSELTFNKDNYYYDKDKKLLTINLENNDKDNISWNKEAQDIFVVTYMLEKEDDITNTTINVNSNITTYDDKELTRADTINISENLDEIVSVDLTSKEASMYKGKIYTGEERTYITNTAVNVNYLDIVDSISIKEEEAKFLSNEQEINSNIVYKSMKLSKTDFLNLFGEDGNLTIQNQDGAVISNINKDIEADEEGNIKITYPLGTTSVQFLASKPINLGTLNIENEKAILNSGLSRDEVKSLTAIREKVSRIDNSQEITSSANIELNNTISKVAFNVNTDKLSSMEKNENVKMTVVLENNGEDKDLYQNPKLKITLPEQVKEITNAKCKLLYGNGLNLGNAQEITENGHKVIEINLNGTQNSYNAEAVEGTTLLIYATLGVDKLAANSDEKISLNYTNDIATNYENNGEQSSKVNIISANGLIITNNIPEYSIETIGNTGTKNVNLDVSKEEKEISVNIATVNNEGTNIKDVKILGNFPTESEGNLNATLTSGINVISNNTEVKVYYSNKENPTEDLHDTNNGWVESVDLALAKSYLIVIDTIKAKEKFEAEYKLKIPENLVYNMKAEEGYKVTYTDEIASEVKVVESTMLALSTGVGPEIESNLKAYVGGEEITSDRTVNVGEIIKYELALKNVGNSTAENVNIEANIPNGTKAVQYTKSTDTKEENGEIMGSSDYIKDVETNNGKLITTIEKLEINEEKKITYEVKVEEGAIGNNVSSNVNIRYNRAEDATNTLTSTATSTINSIQQADLGISIVRIYREIIPMTIDNIYLYEIKVTNQSSNKLSNIEVALNTKYELEEVLDEKFAVVKSKDNKFNVESLAGGEEKVYTIEVKAKEVGNIKISAIANNLYHSNEITEKISTYNLDVIMTSETEGEAVRSGDSIVYNVTLKNENDKTIDYLSVTQEVSTYVNISKVSINNEEVKFDVQYDYDNQTTSNENSSNSENSNNENNMEESGRYYLGYEYVNSIKKGEQVEITIEGTADENYSKPNDIHLISFVKVNTLGLSVQSEEVNHILKGSEEQDNNEETDEQEEPEEREDDNTQEDIDNKEDANNKEDRNDENNSVSEGEKNNEVQNTSQSENNQNVDSNGENKNTNVTTERKTYVISGTAWLDKNENGGRDSDEEKLSGIKVTLLDLQRNSTIATATTADNGFYSFTKVPNGNYIAIFDYDTEKYMLTSYRLDGVAQNRNSDVENVTINMNGEDNKVASTDMLLIKDNDVTGVDIGLVYARTFDMELTKTITKVTISNDNGIQTINYNDSNLAKAEIAAKYLKGSTVAIEYKIKLKNAGEIAGYIKNIVDYKPADLSFNSSLNKDWYQSGDYIYTTRLANTKLEAGESKELTLVLTKTMTETNTGLTNNTAEIKEDYNSLSVADIDSTPGNRQKSEDDMGSSDLIISVKTGAAVSYVSIVLSIIIVLAIGAFMVAKRVIKKEEIEF